MSSLLFLIAGVALGVLILALVTAGEIYEYQDSVDGVHLPPVDAVVCLAGGRGRIAASGDLWYRYWEMAHMPVPEVSRSPVAGRTPVLYFSGLGHQSNWNVVARQVRRGVLPVLKPENILIEKESGNTEENAEWLLRHARQRGWERVLLVTSSYHMKRSKLIFDRVMKANQYPLAIETLSVYQEPFEPGEWRTAIHGIRVTLIEYWKWLYYRAFWSPAPLEK